VVYPRNGGKLQIYCGLTRKIFSCFLRSYNVCN